MSGPAVPGAATALAALKEVRDRVFMAEGRAEDAVVGAVSGAVRTVDAAHDQAMAEAKAFTDQAISALEAVVSGT